MASIELTPLEAFNLARRRWWVIVACVLLGGLLGWGFSRLQAPLYDAQALLVITIDYQQAPELTQKTDDHYTEDMIVGAANAVVISTYVLDQVGAELEQQGVFVDWEKYTRNLASERRRSQFWLRVRDSDPSRAALVANLWAEKAYATLVEFHQHAVRANNLRYYLSIMNNCPSPPAFWPPLPSLCDKRTPAEVLQAIWSVTAQLEKETYAANALSPALTFNLAGQAVVPDTPSNYRSSLLLAAGCLLGCLAGVVVVNIRKPSHES